MAEKPLTSLSVEEMATFLAKKDLSADVTVCMSMTENGISGDLFMKLTEADFKEMAPRISDRISLRRIQQAHRTDEVAKEDTVGPLTPKVKCLKCIDITLHLFFYIYIHIYIYIYIYNICNIILFIYKNYSLKSFISFTILLNSYCRL